MLDDCTCGCLFDHNRDKPPCQFCREQIILFEKLQQQKNDFNSRKRSSPAQSGGRKKSKKLDKGQQTLKQVLRKCSNKNNKQ